MARGLNARHAVKQVDRMLSNPGIDVDQILSRWVPFVIGIPTSLLVPLTGPTLTLITRGKPMKRYAVAAQFAASFFTSAPAFA
jgi:hypothetical protein